MTVSRFADHLQAGDHAGRPAVGDVAEGSLYGCSTHNIVYQADAGAWVNWFVAGSPTSLDAEAVRDLLNTVVTGTSPILVTPDDPGDHLGISLDTTAIEEFIRDTIATFLQAGTNVTLTNDDPGDHLTITASGGGGGGGGGLLEILDYGGTGTSSTNTGTMGDVNAGLTITFTAPASGNVIVRLQGWIAAAPGMTYNWGLRAGSTTVADRIVVYSAAHQWRQSLDIPVSGLTPGASYTYKWAHRCSYNPSELTATMDIATALMEVWEAPA